MLSLWWHRQLIFQLAKREVTGRYKGSVIGLAWSVFNPLLMLLVYTFVFAIVLQSRWGGSGGDGSKTQFATLLFAGMIVMNLFIDVINRSPGLILGNVNYVKKVVFPLEILPIVTIAAALFHSVVSLGVLLIALLLVNGFLHWTIVLSLIVIFPLVILIAGFAWVLASLGVFLRDVGQTIVVMTTILMFLAPVFYPISAVPVAYQPLLMANPMTFIIEQLRLVLIWGSLPDWSGLACYSVFASLIAWLGYAWFQKTRKGFADVL